MNFPVNSITKYIYQKVIIHYDCITANPSDLKFKVIPFGMQNVSNLGFQILFMGIFIKKLLKIKEIHKEVDLFLFDLTIFRG